MPSKISKLVNKGKGAKAIGAMTKDGGNAAKGKTASSSSPAKQATTAVGVASSSRGTVQDHPPPKQSLEII
jgi:hypothetical protein